MTKKTIVKNLIKVYKGAIKDSKEIHDYWELMKYLTSEHLDGGICHYLSHRLRKEIIPIPEQEWYKEHKVWIERNFYKKKDGKLEERWCEFPQFTATREHAIKCLEQRLEILEREFLIP